MSGSVLWWDTFNGGVLPEGLSWTVFYLIEEIKECKLELKPVDESDTVVHRGFKRRSQRRQPGCQYELGANSSTGGAGHGRGVVEWAGLRVNLPAELHHTGVYSGLKKISWQDSCLMLISRCSHSETPAKPKDSSRTSLGKVLLEGKTFHLPDTQHYDLLDCVELKGEILDKMARELPLNTRTATGAFRFCRHCQLIKPDRCHHCSACQICVLKMDHHCLWLNNCVGFSNYKFFLLFLLYSLLYCLCIVTTVTPSFIHLWLSGLFDSSAKLHVLFLTLVSSIFLVTLSCLLLFHWWLVANNKTTLEWLSAPFFPDGPDGTAFDVSVRENILQVFGLDWRLWLLPVSSSQGDGHSFPLRRRTTAHHPIMANGAEFWEQEGIVVSQQGSPVSIAIDD
ncbi:hypothetical protein MHYP_G00274670 [Metynnis hypsauchen]